MSEKQAGRRVRSRHYHQTLRYDVTEPSVQRALLRVLPEVSFLAAARSCSTKSWARERPPGPRPLRSDKFPRGLPDLQGSDLQRVQVDNEEIVTAGDKDESLGFCSAPFCGINSWNWTDLFVSFGDSAFNKAKNAVSLSSDANKLAL